MGLKEKEKLSPAARWERALDGLSESSRKTYTRELRQFLEWSGDTEETLIAFWLDTQDMSLSDYVNDYLHKLTEEGNRGGKQSSVVKALKKFFKVNGHAPVLNVKQMPGGGGVRPAKASEIKTVLKYSLTNPRDAAIIAISKDSALRLSDITRIKFSHIKPIIDDPELNWLCFKIPVLKTSRKQRKALPCLGYEGVHYLRGWLAERSKLNLPTDDDSYVFVNVRNAGKYEAVKQGNVEVRKESRVGQKMEDRNAGVAIGKLFKRAGIPDLSANSLRKFNSTMLTMAGMGEDRVRLMQGKSQRSSVDDYLDAEAEAMLEIYKQFYDSIKVGGEAAQELQQLQEKQQHTNGEMEQIKSQMQSLQDQLEYMKQTAGGQLRVSQEEARLLASVDSGEDDPELTATEYRDFIKWRSQRDKARREAQKQ